ncbi:MAG: glycosyltransferase [Planctomycetota bacterium]
MHILLSNLNPSWGGGELWFRNAALELAQRGHEVRIIVREGSQLSRRLEGTGVELVSEEIDPFEGRSTDVMLANSRKKDVRHLFEFKKTRPRNGLVLRKGIPRPLKDRMWGRKELHALCHILTNSDATSAVVAESLPWFPADRISRLYNPVRFEPLPPVPGDGTLRIVAVSRLVESKALDVLLAAVPLLQRPWSLTIAGDGRHREELEKLADGRVTFLGHVEDVRPVYANADVLAIPSRYEGFCYAAVEASLAELPIVASRVGSLPEVIPDASFVPPDDPQALAAALEAVEVGQRPEAAARARAEFSYDKIFSELERILAEASEHGPVRG